LKFKLDENMPADLAAMLHKEGHNVADIVGEGLAGEDDLPILKVAAKEGRILLTFDLDFADIRQYQPGTHAGIVVFRLRDQRWKTLEDPARRALTEDNLEKLQQGLAIVDETRIRYKRPHRKGSP
jgi:predicted nuclease of predicted toxin-antitoxin system